MGETLKYANKRWEKAEEELEGIFSNINTSQLQGISLTNIQLAKLRISFYLIFLKGFQGGLEYEWEQDEKRERREQQEKRERG